MTYKEAIDSVVTRRQVLRELKAHGANVIEFYGKFGYLTEYKGNDVLGFLGY